MCCVSCFASRCTFHELAHRQKWTFSIPKSSRRFPETRIRGTRCRTLTHACDAFPIELLFFFTSIFVIFLLLSLILLQLWLFLIFCSCGRGSQTCGFLDDALFRSCMAMGPRTAVASCLNASVRLWIFLVKTGQLFCSVGHEGEPVSVYQFIGERLPAKDWV